MILVKIPPTYTMATVCTNFSMTVLFLCLGMLMEQFQMWAEASPDPVQASGSWGWKEMELTDPL